LVGDAVLNKDNEDKKVLLETENYKHLIMLKRA